jgi:hypothetical protein
VEAFMRENEGLRDTIVKVRQEFQQALNSKSI